MKNKVGMYGGSFNPLHQGHVNDIIEASNMCEKLYVVLSYSLNRNEISYKERFKWLKQITDDMPNVEIIAVEDRDNSKETYDWQKGADDIKKAIGNDINIVFCGDDYKEKNIYESLYSNSKIYYFDRGVVNISSTQIREDPYLYMEYLPKVVQSYYTKKVVVLGTESCGKSTLVRNLAKFYNTNYVNEVGRDICKEAGGIDNMQPKDFVEILLAHKLLELKKLKETNKVMFIDTEASVTLYYLNLLYGKDDLKDIDSLGNSIINLSDYDLYLFLEPDVKWIQDGTRTYGEDEVRRKNNLMLKEMLKSRKIHYESISGDYNERYIKAKCLVNKLLYSN